MKQYIDKSAVVAEINKVLNSYDPNEITSGRYALVRLLSFLDTLEVKETGTVWHSFDEVLPQQGSDICVYWDRDEIITTGIWEESEKPKYASKWAYTSDLLKDK